MAHGRWKRNEVGDDWQDDRVLHHPEGHYVDLQEVLSLQSFPRSAVNIPHTIHTNNFGCYA